MASISMGVDEGQLKQLLANVNGLPRELRRQYIIAVNKTTTKVSSALAKSVTQTINVPQKAVKEVIKVDKAVAKTNKTEATVTLHKSDRLPLKDFKPNQTTNGVTYKIDKNKPRQRLRHGFIVNRYGGNVYIRPGKGRATGKRKYGPSPWGVVKRNRSDVPVRQLAQIELRKQLQERIRFTGLKKAGVI